MDKSYRYTIKRGNDYHTEQYLVIFKGLLQYIKRGEEVLRILSFLLRNHKTIPIYLKK